MKSVWFYTLFFAILSIPFIGFKKSPDNTPYVFPELLFFPEMPINQENPTTTQGVKLGRFLFYDSILSRDYSMSCASCHKQKFAFSDAQKQFSSGINGILTQRNTPGLFNLSWYSAYFWDGRAATIEDQVFHPVRDREEMNLSWAEAVQRIRNQPKYRRMFRNAFGRTQIDSSDVAAALAQFVRTLISHNSKFDRVLRGEEYLTKEENRGFVLMNDMTKGDCLHCHPTDADALGTTGGFSNNGLDSIDAQGIHRDAGLMATTGKKVDHGKFKIPSLRNITLTAPYMHDGRFQTLEE
ncbi:MAG: cytochrome-c peroxidase, partial [Flavobacteriales bacterium]